MEHPWPGNVRELKNAVESAAVLAVDQTIDGEGFDLPIGEPSRRRGEEAPSAAGPGEDARAIGEPSRRRGEEAPSAAGPGEDARAIGELRIALPAPLASVERQVILAHVQRCSTRREAARTLGIGLRTLYTKLREYGLDHQ
jgi:DNA-binding NtrC family response regulator